MEGDDIISEDQKVAQKLNDFLSNNVKFLEIPKIYSYFTNPTDHLTDSLEIAIQKFKVHPSVLKIRGMVQSSNFNFHHVSLKEIEKEISCLDTKKSSTINSIPITSLNENIDIIGTIIHNIYFDMIAYSQFPHDLKLADIYRLYKGVDVTNKKHYRPISVLPAISKVFRENITKTNYRFCRQIFVQIYVRISQRVQYSICTHNIVGEKEIYFRQPWLCRCHNYGPFHNFDTINHGLLLAKLHAYGFDTTSIIKSYLENRWHRIKINTSVSTWCPPGLRARPTIV